MFIDKVKIKIKGGNGGDGHVSFHTEKFVANGGPDGGDGGRGGSIIFVADSGLNTLSDFYYRKHFRAPDGQKGGIKKCSGKSGEDIIVRVPCGTIVKDVESGRIIADMFYDQESRVILKGGRGGKGNAHFASSRRQSPRFAQKGEECLERELELELKSIADAGLVGFPNAGKSTYLSVVSSARPKIANYHFTTLSPNLGVVRYHDASWVVADIPGLIEGASQGAGLGHKFLRHIERVRLILHIIDLSGSEGRDPFDDYLKINLELKAFSKYLAKLKQIIVLNKCDLLEDKDKAVGEFKAKLKAQKGRPPAVYAISGITHDGIGALNAHIAKSLKDLPKPEPLAIEEFKFETDDPNSFNVLRIGDNIFELTGALTKRLEQNVVFDDYDSLKYFHKMLKNYGVIQKLYDLGAKEGDTVIMGEMEFDFVD